MARLRPVPELPPTKRPMPYRQLLIEFFNSGEQVAEVIPSPSVKAANMLIRLQKAYRMLPEEVRREIYVCSRTHEELGPAGLRPKVRVYLARRET